MNGKKMSFANIKNMLSKDEMKKISGGSGSSANCSTLKCTQGGVCRMCEVQWCYGLCYCSNGLSPCY
jgi:hypothetical protein